MSKTIKTAQDVVLPTSNDVNKIVQFVKAAVAAYGAGKVRVHVAACVALHRAASDDGNTKALNVLSEALDPKERTKLRIWVGRKTAFTGSDGKIKYWMKYDQANGYAVRKGSASIRADLDRNALIDGDRFYAPPKVEKAETEKVEALFTWFDNLNKSLTKRFEDAELDFPKAVQDHLNAAAREMRAWKAERELEAASTASETMDEAA